MSDDVIFRKVCKGKNQNRVTIPKVIESTYVAIKPVEQGFMDFFKRRKK